MLGTFKSPFTGIPAGCRAPSGSGAAGCNGPCPIGEVFQYFCPPKLDKERSATFTPKRTIVMDASQEPEERGGVFTKELCNRMWQQVVARLKQGQVLVRQEDFVEALAQEFSALVGRQPTATDRNVIQAMVSVVNRKHPETYLAQGMENSVVQAFEGASRRLKWDQKVIEAKGTAALKRFAQSDAIRTLLEDFKLDPDQLDTLRCVRQLIDRTKGAASAPKRQGLTYAQRWAAEQSKHAPLFSSSGNPVQIDNHVEAAIAEGDFDRQEVRERMLAQQQRQEKLVDAEVAKAAGYTEALVDRGVLVEGEAAQVKAYEKVRRQLEGGEIDAKEAERLTGNIATPEQRERLDGKIREAMADSVRYLLVFESMKKIETKADGVFNFLIRHKEAVMAGEKSSADLGAALQELLGDQGLLESIFWLMERQDREIRMLTIRLPPYNLIAKRGVERIGNLVIEPAFVDQLRQETLEDMSARLNHPQADQRIRPAADMRCLIALVDHVVKRTRFRKELRVLRVGQQLEAFFANTPDLKEARHQAEIYLQRRFAPRLWRPLRWGEPAHLSAGR